MKNASQKVIILVIIIATVFSMVTTASAYTFTQYMRVGETYTLALSDTPYVSSDPDVVQILSKGHGIYTAVAVGEGTATITGGTRLAQAYNACVITVTSPNAEQSRQEQSNPMSKFFHTLSDTPVLWVCIGCCVLLVFLFICLAFVGSDNSPGIKQKLDTAMQNIRAYPCQQTAVAAVEEFANLSTSDANHLANGGDRQGVHFNLWREVFNHTVIPCKNIRWETKDALRKALVRLNTYGLSNVIPTQTPEEAKAAAEAFGAGGEDNVWHNLKVLPGCDVYRNVRICNGSSASEIDAVIVDASKGIFLVETKSKGGIRTADGNKLIQYHQLKEDPSNQIYRHEFDFKTYFADLGIDHKVKNVLVFSWPNGDTRRILDRNSFPQEGYDLITVEQLISYHRSQPSTAIVSDYERHALAARLKLCSSECVIR